MRLTLKRLTAWLGGFALAVAGGLATASPAQAAEPSKEGIEFFEKNIRPVLVESCYGCHSAEAKTNKKLKGKFYADSMEGLTKGGDSGNPGIVPNEPDKSTVIKGIRYEYTGDDESLNMPPKSKKDGKGGKLSAEVIKNFEQWVKMGAPAPKEFAKPKEPKADAGKGSDPKADASSSTSTSSTNAAGDPKAHWAFGAPALSPVPAVKTQGWASNEIDAFVLAKLEAKGLRPAAHADRRTLIRRATFDLIGLPPTPEEVEAFVGDKSPDAYEKVIDRLLADPRYGERWARHWLDVARYADTKGYVFQEERRYPYAYTYRDYVIEAFNADKPYDQFLVEQIAADHLDLKNDKRPLAAMGFLTLGRRFLNNVHDIIDDRIDVVTRGTMGLTVACARCHDHKFDPVPTKDYYALHGVFASSVEPKDPPLLGDGKASPAYEAELAKRQAAVDEYIVKARDEILGPARTAKGFADHLFIAATTTAVGRRGGGGAGTPGEPGGDLNPAVVSRFRMLLAASAQKKDPIFAAWRMYAAAAPEEFEAKAKQVTARLAKDDDKATPVHPLVRKAFAGTEPPKSLREGADRYGQLLAKFDKAEKLADADEEALRLVLRGPESPLAVATADVQTLFRRDHRDRLSGLQKKVAELEATSPGAPPRAMVLTDAPNPRDSNILIRGNPGNPGITVPRRFLQVIAGPDGKPFTQGSGRLEFARAIASKDNPLTARVFVNRVWGWHFGRGIVTTPSDFGVRSDPPSHPELLDWLAVTFVNDGWSVKKLHRRILLSGTYRQASDDNPAARAVDPENALLWRQNIQRLDFEGMRDTLLAVSGQLNPARLGRPVDLANPAETRRTIYGFIDRQNLPSMFRSFDFAGPDMHAPQRSQTTVPQQALFFINSPFAQRQAKLLLERPDVKSQPNAAAKVRRLYQLMFNREPSADEVAAGQAFLDAEQQTPTDEPAVTAPRPIWSYGYGRLDDAKRKLAAFEPLAYFSKRTGWRGGKSLPDPETGHVALSDKGGHPGDANHAAIRRWTAPSAGTVDVAGTLAHAEKNGDGVRGRIVSGRTGVLGEWAVHNGKADTNLKGLNVEAGETINFVVDCRGSVEFDTFAWAPTVTLTGPQVAGGRRQFDAARDFSGANEPPVPPVKLTAWEKYAQVLMSSNELVFVD